MNPEFPPLPLYPASLQPRANTRAVLYFGDGAIRIGFWNGTEWVTELGTARPENWQGLPISGLN